MKVPAQATRFLRWFCKPSIVDEIEGDLYEEYARRYENRGRFYATFSYWIDVITFFRPFALRGFTHTNNLTMFRNYLLIAFRSMNKQRLFTSINVVGLAFSMLVGLVIITVIVDQSTFDIFHKNKDRIYRVISTSKYMHFEQTRLATAPVPLAAELNKDNIEKTIVIRRSLTTDVSYKENTFQVSGHYASKDFLNALSFPLLTGNPETALVKPNTIVLTKIAANKIFGEGAALGETVTLKDLGEFTVTGVLEDIPRNSHMQFEVLASYATVSLLEKEEKVWPTVDNWLDYSSSYVYLLLKDNASTANIQRELDQIAQARYGANTEHDISFSLQALTDINPGPDLSNQIGPMVAIEFVYVCMVLALVVLISASFNYTNLSIARSLRRAREIGIRKIQGGSRYGVFSQFMLESIVVSVLSLLVALLIFQMIKPSLQPFMPNDFVSLDFTLTTIVLFILFTLFTGIVAGFLPAFLLSKVQALQILKGNSSLKIFGGLGFKKGLLVAQFALSMVFIVITITAYRQYVFSLEYNMGFRKENIVNVRLQGMSPEVFAQKFSQLADVEKISFSSYTMATGTNNNTWVKLDDPLDSTIVGTLRVDENFDGVHDIEIIAGKGFNPQLGSGQALINTYLANRLGYEDVSEIVGKKMKNSGGNELTIVGVSKDFNYTKIKSLSEGFFLQYDPEHANVANILFAQSANWNTLYPKMKSVWSEVDQDVHEFSADLYSNQLKDAYSDMVFVMKLIGSIAFMVILIASLGLLGMVVYTVDVRVREIGIRKVLGADELQLVHMLSTGFLKMIFIAGMIASVLAYMIVFHLLLPQMAYKTEIGVTEFLMGFGALLLPGLLFIFPAVLKASRTNPAETLKYE